MTIRTIIKRWVFCDEESTRNDLKREAENMYGIKRIDGTDYILFGDNVICSSKQDAENAQDLLDRLEGYRMFYYEKCCHEMYVQIK